MRLSNIQIKNFKTFKDVSIDLNNQNLFIGACASGKSNFVEIFDFIKDMSHNFDKAFHKHGGVYLQNFNLKNDNNPTCLKVSFDNCNDSKFSLDLPKTNTILEFNHFNYEICLTFKDFDYKIKSENVEFKFDVYEIKDDSKSFICEKTLSLKNLEGEFSAKLNQDDSLVDIEDLIPNQLLNISQNNFKINNTPLINSPLASMPFQWGSILDEIGCFNFNPQFSKSISKVNGNVDLLRYGENLAVILNKIFKNDEYKRKFLNLVNDLLPYINDIEVNQISDDQMFFSILEQNKSIEIPSLFISDGTSNVIALVIALYFDNSKFLFIEEPERNIHPSLLSKLVDMVGEASKNKQIIITTHSPEILKYMDLDDVYFILKDEEGNSNLSKPIDNEMLKPFIEEFGIDEIFIDNYMEFGNE